jgi:ABC-type phosphate transport system substrate-binding protein
MRSWAFIFVIVGLSRGFSVPLLAQSSVFEGFVVIGNATGIVSLTEDEARAVFQGKKSVWSNGKPILIVLPNSKNPVSAVIARRLFSTDTQGMQRYWLSQVFQGRANAPVFIEEWDAVVKKVRDVEGAIALVPRGTSVPSELILSIR